MPKTITDDQYNQEIIRDTMFLFCFVFLKRILSFGTNKIVHHEICVEKKYQNTFFLKKINLIIELDILQTSIDFL